MMVQLICIHRRKNVFPMRSLRKRAKREFGYIKKEQDRKHPCKDRYFDCRNNTEPRGQMKKFDGLFKQ